ncbi:hypothetical protein AVEN_142582-1 [Araneus ventricosus]|uniref:Gustatory receptor n=1 Tax=Araneus ventricosus TaxID=182803 RepID=A0A4Y2CFW2_ARAVE|nr:hypothetical protein AVEN_142582-1 [Araneus ventricosus]
MNELKMICVLFYLFGIYALDRSKISFPNPDKEEMKNQRIIPCLRCFPKYIILIIFLLKITAALAGFNFEVDKKSAIARSLVATLVIILYVTVYRNRRVILRMTVKLSETAKIFPDFRLRRIKCAFITFFVFVIALTFFKGIVNHLKPIVDKRNEMRNFSEINATKASLNFQLYYQFLALKSIAFLFHITACTFLAVFTVFYCLVCIFLRKLFVELLHQIKTDHSINDFRRYLYVFRLISRIMKDMENFFSFSVFVMLLITMIGLFRAGYRLAFDPKTFQEKFLYLLFSGIYNMLLQVMIMISASIANEEAEKVVESLPGLIPKHENDLKLEFKNEFQQHKSLSLWKIYTFDRSLLITSLGTLLTYGVLIGTLGRGN